MIVHLNGKCLKLKFENLKKEHCVLLKNSIWKLYDDFQYESNDKLSHRIRKTILKSTLCLLKLFKIVNVDQNVI